MLVISSRNYSSWCLRGWLLTRLAGLHCRVRRVESTDAVARAELLLQTATIRIPWLEHEGLVIWDVLAIAEYLHERFPDTQMMPKDRAARARCRSISGEMHAGFTALRASLPVNLRAFRPNFPIWSGVRADIDRVTEIWRECIAEWGGPYLFGSRLSVADALYAPVCTRFTTYDVELDDVCESYKTAIMTLPDMKAWIAAAKEEPDEVSELEVEVEF
ncbi:MAG TPA: glutathione S-transferase [Acetobacteraceae bacterium]|nr:glutathione S-transferase [Acetobacteraceae bacterium]